MNHLKKNVFNKWLAIILLAVCLVCSLLLFTACNGEEVYVFFYYEDRLYQTYTLKEGQSLANIPACKEKTGYTTYWNKNEQDFINIRKDLRVDAIITPNEYEVTYGIDEIELNDDVYLGNDGKYHQIIKYDEEYTLASVLDNGKTFACWRDENGVFVNAKSVWKLLSDITVTPDFVQSKFTVTFIGVTERTEYTFNKGEKLTQDYIPEITEKEVGYDLSWNIDLDTLESVDSDTVYTVKRTPKSFNVSFSLKEDESINDTTGLYIEDETYYKSLLFAEHYTLPVPQKTNCSFVTWKDENNNSINLSGVSSFSEDTVLTPVWIDARIQYSIFFVTEDDIISVTMPYDELLSIDDSRVPEFPVKTGVTYDWNVNFAEVNYDKVVNLTASPMSFKIYYQTEDCEILVESIFLKTDEEGRRYTEVMFGEKYELSYAYNSLYSNKYLSYWQNVSTGEKLVLSGVWDLDFACTVKPVWADGSTYESGEMVEDKYEITFISLDGTAKTVQVDKDCYIDEKDIPTSTELVGYNTFWNIDVKSLLNSNTTVFEIKEAIVSTLTIVLQEDEFFFTDNFTDLGEGKYSVEYFYNQSYSYIAPTKTGYEFVCWKDQYDRPFKNEGLFESVEDLTIHAEWEERFYKVTIVDATTTTTKTYRIGETVTGTYVLPEEKGYIYTWSEKGFGSNYVVSKDVIIIPVKTPISSTVYFKLKEGEVLSTFADTEYVRSEDGYSIYKTVVSYGTSYLFQTANVYGKNFIGWQDENGNSVNLDGVWLSTTDKTLTPVWKPIYYILTFITPNETKSIPVEVGSVLDKNDDRIPSLPNAEEFAYRWNVSDFSTLKQDAVITAVPNKVYTLTYITRIGKFIFNGEQVNMVATEVANMDVIQLPTVSNVFGYVFEGWYYQGRLLKEGDIYLFEKDVTLEAKMTQTEEWSDFYK